MKEYKTIGVSVPPRFYETFRTFCKDKELVMSQFVREAIKEKMNKENSNGKEGK